MENLEQILELIEQFKTEQFDIVQAGQPDVWEITAKTMFTSTFLKSLTANGFDFYIGRQWNNGNPTITVYK